MYSNSLAAYINWKLELLRNELISLRHLPPTASLLPPQGILAQRLFDTLLHLEDGVDPVSYLQTEKGEEVALIAMGLLLDFLALAYGIKGKIYARMPLEQLPEILKEIEAKYSSIFGKLLEVEEQFTGPGSCVKDIKGKEDVHRLKEALMWFCRRSGFESETSPNRFLFEPGEETLIADLLRLPEDIDSLRWLQEQRSLLCAYLVLEHLIKKSIPSKDLEELRSLKNSVRSLPLRVKVQDSISVDIKRIDFFAIGFAIHIHAQFCPPQSVIPLLQKLFNTVRWEGFTQVMDSNGNHYIRIIANSEITKGWKTWKEDLVLICWPAFSNHSLILKAEPNLLYVYRPPTIGGTRIKLPIPLSSFTISIPLEKIYLS